MAFRPNCGRPFDHPRWADGDALARAFIMEMKDDLCGYLTNSNAAIHEKITRQLTDGYQGTFQKRASICEICTQRGDDENQRPYADAPHHQLFQQHFLHCEHFIPGTVILVIDQAYM